MIEIKNLEFSYFNKKVLKGISYEFETGVLTAVMGPNGSGKTTLIKNIAGFLKPSSGEILIDGKTISDINVLELAKIVGYVPQKPQFLPSITVAESILNGRIPFFKYNETSKDKKICSSIIKEFSLSSIKDRNINQISGGELQKTLIAQALAKQPKILLLDEPLNNLDIKNQIEIMKNIVHKTKKENITTIAILHDLNFALKYCDRILFMKEGKILFSGKNFEINSEILREVFEVECQIIKDENSIYALY